MSILQFRPRRPQSALDGFYFAKPVAEQHARIRQLAQARLSPEQIAQLVRLSFAEVTAIVNTPP